MTGVIAAGAGLLNSGGVETADLFLDSEALTAGRDGESRPLMLVDLSGVMGDVPGLRMPPCPLIGVGDAAHPLAHRLDAVVERPVMLPTLLAAIGANRQAAAVVVQLLRGIEGLGMEAALVQESMAYGLLQAGGEHGAWLAARRVGAVLPPGALRLERVGERLEMVIDRPDARNAIDRTMRDALREAFELATLDPDAEQVVLRSVGRAFCVGADLEEFGTTRDPVVAHGIRMATLPAHAIVRCREKLRVHVQGACVGAGLEMAAFAARVVADRGAWFQLPELAMGLLPGAGGCVSVSRRIGRQRAALMILSGKRIDAATALSWGLIDAIMDDGAAEDGHADIVG
ncbi:MAG TPA: enoyl-CoA hydratase/isomerase family protein [Sphingobium sp.]